MDTVDLRIKEVKNAMYNDLYHHGILGMKWGIRRYQSYDTVPRGSGEGGKEIGLAKKSNSDKRTDKIAKKQLKKDKKLVDKNLNIVGENTRKIDAELRKEVAETQEYKNWEAYNNELTRVYNQLQKEHPGAQLLVNKDDKEYHEKLNTLLNNKVSNIVTNNLDKYAEAKLMDLNIKDISPELIKYTRDALYKNKII